MNKKKTLADLYEEEQQIYAQLRIAKQKLKSIQYQHKRYEMKNRTHRLCTIGGTVTHYMPLDEYSDDQIICFLDTVFKIPELQQFAVSLKEPPK